jgi:hypothetical protein
MFRNSLNYIQVEDNTFVNEFELLVINELQHFDLME